MSWVRQNRGVMVMAATSKRHLSQEDKLYWDELYEYVRNNVMCYDKNQSLSRNMVLRLKGLANNKFMANNNTENTANYSYKTILNTFKFCMPDIQTGLRNGFFKDENHKFNYILKIVESNLNNVYLKMKNAEKTEEEIDSHDITNAANYVNNFNPKESNRNNGKKYNDLW